MNTFKTKGMTRVITEAIPSTVSSQRLRMTLAFIAGIILAAVLLLTLTPVNTTFPAPPGSHDSLAPGTAPADGIPVRGAINRLVYTCPGREIKALA